MIVESVGIFDDISVFVFDLISVLVQHCAVGVLTVKSAKTADGKRPQSEQLSRLFIAFFDDCRAETYRKFVDFKA